MDDFIKRVLELPEDELDWTLCQLFKLAEDIPGWDADRFTLDQLVNITTLTGMPYSLRVKAFNKLRDLAVTAYKGGPVGPGFVVTGSLIKWAMGVAGGAIEVPSRPRGRPPKDDSPELMFRDRLIVRFVDWLREEHAHTRAAAIDRVVDALEIGRDHVEAILKKKNHPI